jgi:N4-(beta-N-acetylglucosaminyl)-L-asparaginase
MNTGMSRRRFVASTAAAASLSTLAIGQAPIKAAGAKRPVIVASANGLRAVEKAMELVKKGHDPLDSAIEGVAIIEADPKDHSVGYGGLPNEEGVVELDAAVMHGPTHGGGSVASIRNIMHPAAVARAVMQRSRHCLLVGNGALKFARAHGFPEVNLLTDDARQIWLHWKETRDANDDWLPPPDEKVAAFIREALSPRVTGTIHCSVLDTHGDLGCTTTTSGLSWKIPGRVGDSPILGAGLYLDNTVGSCGSVGLGEVNLLNCASFLVVENLRRGMKPKDALVATCKRVVETTTRDPRFRDDRGKPTFNVVFYCLNKDGKFAAAHIHGPASLAVHDGEQAKMVDSAGLLD